MAEGQKQDLIKALEDFFKKLPNLPASGREVLVSVVPWIALIFGILGVLAGLGAVGVSPLALFGGLSSSFTVLVMGVATIVASVLMLMAFPKLTKKAYKGWELLFWSEVVNTVAAVMALSVGSILGVLVGFYLLFQIKSYYK